MNDCISRQAAIDALEREKTYSAVYKYGYTQTDYFKQYNMGLTDGIKVLNKLPSAQPQRWIPVTEALPEYDFTDVLICLHDVRHGCEDDYYIVQAYTVRGHWKPTLDINIDDLDVVAWMPLPPVYEGGQDE